MDTYQRKMLYSVIPITSVSKYSYLKQTKKYRLALVFMKIIRGSQAVSVPCSLFQIV